MYRTCRLALVGFALAREPLRYTSLCLVLEGSAERKLSLRQVSESSRRQFVANRTSFWSGKTGNRQESCLRIYLPGSQHDARLARLLFLFPDAATRSRAQRAVLRPFTRKKSISENGTIAIKHRDSERKVSRQRMLFVANVHVSFPRFGEAIPEQCRVQARGGGITCDIVRRKGAEAIDERRDCGLPTGRILGIKPTIHYSSKPDSSVRSDFQDGEADHSLRCVNRPAREARQRIPKKVIEQQVVTLARHNVQ